MKILDKGRRQVVKYDNNGPYFTRQGSKEHLSEYIRTNAFKEDSSDYLKVDDIDIHATKAISNVAAIGINVDYNGYGDQVILWVLIG